MDIQQFFLDIGLSPSIVIVIISSLPIVELRGAIPVAINVMDFPWVSAYFLAVLGNMLPVPIILRLLSWVAEKVKLHPWGNAFFLWLFERTQKRSGIINKYRCIGLIMFVAIPLPLTGAWTGAIAAVILGIDFRNALLSIFMGVVIAGVIVTWLAMLGWTGLFIAVILLTGVYTTSRLRRNP